MTYEQFIKSHFTPLAQRQINGRLVVLVGRVHSMAGAPPNLSVVFRDELNDRWVSLKVSTAFKALNWLTSFPTEHAKLGAVDRLKMAISYRITKNRNRPDSGYRDWERDHRHWPDNQQE